MTKPSPTVARVASLIVFVRGQKAVLDSDLADLYGVSTKALVQAVKRNLTRFPADFMFLLTDQDLAILRSQIVTSSSISALGWASLGDLRVHGTRRRDAFLSAP